MTSARAHLAALLLAALALGSSAASALAAPSLAAIVPPAAAPDDVRQSTLIGPSGQLWEPDGAGSWVRRTEGGVAADVMGATRAAGMLVVAGRATPFYRRDGDRWLSMRLGERGRTLIANGPRAAVAIGRQVFVHTGTAWKRIATAGRPFKALWAASETRVFAGSELGVVRLVGGGFVAHATTPIVAFGSGATPWAVTSDGGVLDLTTRRVHRPSAAGVAVAASQVTIGADGTAWVLGRTTAGVALVRLRKGTWTVAPPPPLGAADVAVALAVDRAGRLLVATRGGAVFVGAADGTWMQGTLTEALPAPHAGPGPARTR